MFSFWDGLRNSQGGTNTILVQSAVPVGAAVPSIVHAIDFTPSFLCECAVERKNGLLVVKLAEYSMRVDVIFVIQSDAEGLGRLESLQEIHIVGDDSSVLLWF